MVSDNVREFILPVCDAKIEDGQVVAEGSKLVGTCFLIGSRGYALTAAHVIDQMDESAARVFVPDPVGFDVSNITEHEKHSDEDIGILKIDLPRPIISPIIFADHEPPPSYEYSMWAFPEVIAEEVRYHDWPRDLPQFRPAHVYFRGYVRRKLSHSPNPSFSSYVGKHFYEVSEIAGACSSGAALTTITNPPAVFAIYIGDEQTGRRCGYAMNAMKVLDWTPRILGKAIRDEAVGANPVDSSDV
ncbi:MULTISPECIES: serine protease [unclassified Bradyrhizobium]|nr:MULTISPECIES: serine protease [unclassified Bradyrhizobium]